MCCTSSAAYSNSISSKDDCSIVSYETAVFASELLLLLLLLGEVFVDVGEEAEDCEVLEGVDSWEWEDSEEEEVE